MAAKCFEGRLWAQGELRGCNAEGAHAVSNCRIRASQAAGARRPRSGRLIVGMATVPPMAMLHLTPLLGNWASTDTSRDSLAVPQPAVAGALSCRDSPRPAEVSCRASRLDAAGRRRSAE